MILTISWGSPFLWGVMGALAGMGTGYFMGVSSPVEGDPVPIEEVVEAPAEVPAVVDSMIIAEEDSAQ